jgi:cell wall-associated NlpC family hydrolase
MPTDVLPHDTLHADLPTDDLSQDLPGPQPGPAPGWSPISAAVGAPLPDSVTGAISSVNQTQLDTLAAQEQTQANAQRQAALTGTTVVTGGIPQVSGTGPGAQIIAAAEKYLGTPYVWGGTGPGGVDCSGLVQAAYRAAGISLPRVSYQQANAGMQVTTKALRPGDLVAWDNSARNNGADHIAIYLGNGRIIEAAHPGSNVRIRSLGKNEGAYGVRMGW